MADKYYNHENDYYNPSEDSGENANWKALQKAFSNLPTGGGGDSPVILVTCEYDPTDPNAATTGAELQNLTITNDDFNSAIAGEKMLFIATYGKINGNTATAAFFTAICSKAPTSNSVIGVQVSSEGARIQVEMINTGTGWTGTLKISLPE